MACTLPAPGPATAGSAPQYATPVPATGTVAQAAAARARAIDSGELFQGLRIVEISHNGVLYRLQATRLGKLILTK